MTKAMIPSVFRSGGNGDLQPGHKRSGKVAVVRGLWAYVAALLGLWLVLYCGADRWWFATVMMFAPRWPYAVPLPLFAIAAIGLDWRHRGLIVLATLIVLFPIMRFCLPWQRINGPREHDVRVLTFNVAHDLVKLDRLSALINSTRPDVVALQECSNDVSPALPRDWSSLRAGNIVIASRWPIESLEVVRRRVPSGEQRPEVCHIVEVDAPGLPFKFAAVHLLSPREGLAQITDALTVIRPSRRQTLIEQTKCRRTEHCQVSDAIGQFDGPMVIAGDFNTPTDSAIYRESWRRFANAFSHAGFGLGRTARARNGGILFHCRVDHILASDDWSYRACWIARDVRSDHSPLIAELKLNRALHSVPAHRHKGGL